MADLATSHTETPSHTETRTATLARVVAGIKANEHAKVLIVGCRGDNFPEPWRSHPQLLFWDGDDASSREVPQAVRLILVTRFLGHHGYGRLNDISAKRNIVFGVETMGTGQIKDLLRPLTVEKPLVSLPDVSGQQSSQAVIATPLSQADPEIIHEEEHVVGKLKPFGRGELAEFIRQHGNPHARPRVNEADRLEALARSMGWDAGAGSIKQTLYQAENRGQQAAVPRSEKKPVPENKPRIAPTPLSLTAMADDDAELVRMLDQALSDITATLGLLRETVVKRAEKRRQLKEMLKEL